MPSIGTMLKICRVGKCSCVNSIPDEKNSSKKFKELEDYTWVCNYRKKIISSINKALSLGSLNRVHILRQF